MNHSLPPVGWENKFLGEIVGRITTGKLDANAMNPDGDFPFFTCAREQYWIDKFAFDTEALLVSGNGANVGYVHYYNGKFNAYQRTYVLANFSEDVQFIRHYLDRNLYERIRVEVNAGNTPYITMGTLSDMSLAIPSDKAEQKAIAIALSDIDALLDSIDRLIAKKRDLKHAAMQQLLAGQTRLPGFGLTSSFISDELGKRPQDWEAIPLNALIDPSRPIRYGIVQPGEYDRNGRYMIRGQDYSAAKGWANPSDVFRVSAAVEQRYRSARVQSGDLIMTIVGYCGHVDVVPDWLDGANLTQTTARIAIQPQKASQLFCKYMLQSSVGRSQVSSFLKGAAQPGLNCGDVEKFRILLPSMGEQIAISTILSDMDYELDALEKYRDKTSYLKQGMMQELLTGRTRLV